MLSIILPTYNERENIQKIIEAILKNTKDVEIIIVDDNSPDGTGEIVKKMDKKNVKLVTRIGKRGLSGAIIEGIKNAKGEYVMWMDADFSHPPEKIPEMIKHLEGHHIVKGSRFIKGAGDTRGLVRKATSFLFNGYATLILSKKVTDWDTQFVIVKKEVFKDVQIKHASHGQYLVRFFNDAIKKGYKIKEVPFTFNDRKWGTSKTVQKWYSLAIHGWNYGIYVLRVKIGK